MDITDWMGKEKKDNKEPIIQIIITIIQILVFIEARKSQATENQEY